MLPTEKCFGGHEIYVAEVVAVPSEGKVVVITVCRSCDRVNFQEKQIARPHVALTFLKEKEKQDGVLL